MVTPKIYFYCRDEEDNLQEDVIAIAEGLRELGIPYFANCDYWRRSPVAGDFLFRRTPEVSPEDCDAVVVSYTWPHWVRMKTFEFLPRALPEGLFRKGRRYRTVFIDNHDGHRTVSWEPEFRQFDLILRSKLNRRAWHPGNMNPWASGLNQRILKATEGAPPFWERRKAILVNFGASHSFPHGVREIARARFEPGIQHLLPIDRAIDDLSVEPIDSYEALMWRQTGGRFSRAYYERLKHNQAVACFCGDLIPPMPFRNPERYMVGGNKAKVRRAVFEFLAWFDPRPWRSVQWDSFRFWETLAAGCVAFNLDLEHYGVDLPVMPRNWVDYIGVDFENVDATLKRLADDPDCMQRIAETGRNWALEHYSPRAVARRFLAEAGLANS